MIDDIVWYIPFKKLRNAVREYLNYKLQIEIDKLSVLNKIDNYMNRHKGYYEKLINKSAEETYEYVSNVLSKYDVPFMPHCYYELEYILKNKPLIDGLFLEFGVYTGSTINLMSNILKDKMFYGFDSFEGLPEDWIGSNCTKGSFSLNGNLPIVNDNVKLIKGWFNESLPVFLNEHKGNIAFMHIDSDDWIHKDCIRLCVKKQIETNSDIVSVDIMRIYSKKKRLDHFPQFDTVSEFTIALLNTNIAHNVVGRLISRSLYSDSGIRACEGVNMSEDFNVMPRLSYFAKRITSVSEPLYYYDLRNSDSYTSIFSEDNFYQVQKALDILKDFFSDKGADYLTALESSRFRSFMGYLIRSGRESDHREFYEKLRTQLNLFPKEFERSLALPKRIAFHIRWYPFFSLYIRIATYVKRNL